MFEKLLKAKTDSESLTRLEKGTWKDSIDHDAKSRCLITGADRGNMQFSKWESEVKFSLSAILKLFAVSPYDLPGRILQSMVPPVLDRFRVIHVDLLGPTLAILSLLTIMYVGSREKQNLLESAQTILYFAIFFPILTFVFLRCCKAAITFLQLVTLLGYSLYGSVFTLATSLLIDHEKSNTIFFLCLSIFGGLTTIRVVLVVLASLRIPAARLLICSMVAVIQLLFAVSLHFTYLHPTFEYGRSERNA